MVDHLDKVFASAVAQNVTLYIFGEKFDGDGRGIHQVHRNQGNYYISDDNARTESQTRGFFWGNCVGQDDALIFQYLDNTWTEFYATGTSSGAMMANILAGAYPNVFKAITTCSGVAGGCFYVSSALLVWQPLVGATTVPTARFPRCLMGRSRPQLLSRIAGTALPTQPSCILTMLRCSNSGPIYTTSSSAKTSPTLYTQSIYRDGTQVVGFSAAGVGHNVPIHESVELAYYGLWSSRGSCHTECLNP